MSSKKQQNRKHKILQAANKLFNHYGFEKTTIDDIAKEAELGKGSIYLEFESKDSILMTLIQNFVEKELNEIEDYIQFLKSNPRGSKASILKHTQELFLNHILRIFDLATSQLHSTEALIHTSNRVRSESETFFSRKHKLLAELLELADKAGTQQSKTRDYQYEASLISKGMCGLMPPYTPHVNSKGKLTNITKAELKTYSKDLLEILFRCT